MTSLVRCALGLALLAAGPRASTAAAQEVRCSAALSGARWPTLEEVVDSAAAVDALRAAASRDRAVTAATMVYGAEGRIVRVTVRGAASRAARRAAEAAIQSRARPPRDLPPSFELDIARFNEDDHVSLMARTVTCDPPQLRPRSADSILRNLQHMYVGRLRDAVVGLWLERTGEIRAVWLERSSGDTVVDGELLNLARAFRYGAALVGDQPVPLIGYQEFKFR